MNVPDYDLLPVNAVHQALLLLRDIFETENDSVFNSFADKKSMHAKVVFIFVARLSRIKCGSFFCGLW